MRMTARTENMAIRSGSRGVGRRRRSARRALLGAAIPLLLAACGSDEAQMAVKHYGNYTVAIETRPSPIEAGVDEVVVVITGIRHRPLWDALVRLRALPNANWVQAIEDGHTGVYRRAVDFGVPTPTGPLHVEIEENGKATEIDFPLSLIDKNTPES